MTQDLVAPTDADRAAAAADEEALLVRAAFPVLQKRCVALNAENRALRRALAEKGGDDRG